MIRQFKLLNIEYNMWNGIVIEIISLDDLSLFGIGFGFRYYFTIDILFKTFKIY